jgi:hypothetical protein
MKRNALVCIAALLSIGAAHAQKRDANDPDQKELYKYVLTMDKIKKLGSVTHDMQEAAKKHPELNSAGGDGDSKDLNDMVSKLQKYPEVVSILSRNGVTPREYAVGFFTLLQASMAVGFKKGGAYKEYPPEMLQLVSRQNLDFVDQHFDEIRKLVKMGDDQ